MVGGTKCDGRFLNMLTHSSRTLDRIRPSSRLKYCPPFLRLRHPLVSFPSRGLPHRIDRSDCRSFTSPAHRHPSFLLLPIGLLPFRP